jgi:hypothetical protein
MAVRGDVCLGARARAEPIQAVTKSAGRVFMVAVV